MSHLPLIFLLIVTIISVIIPVLIERPGSCSSHSRISWHPDYYAASDTYSRELCFMGHGVLCNGTDCTGVSGPDSAFIDSRKYLSQQNLERTL